MRKVVLPSVKKKIRRNEETGENCRTGKVALHYQSTFNYCAEFGVGDRVSQVREPVVERHNLDPCPV